MRFYGFMVVWFWVLGCMVLGVGLYGFRLWVMGIRSWVIWVFSYGFLLSVKLMQRYSFCFNKAIFLEIIHKKDRAVAPYAEPSEA